MNDKRAVEIMTGWLGHKNELGKKPAKIKAAGSFSYEGNTYVILKFKPDLFGKWEVGVVGFDEEGNECGHTFSEFEEYDETTAKDRCIAMIEYLKEYWRGRFLSELERRDMMEEEYNSLSEEERKKKWDEADEQNAVRVGSVLLKDTEIDFDALSDALIQAFDVTDENCTRDAQTLVFSLESNMISVALMDTPVPDGEAEFYAEGNFLWREAVETTKQHQAHLLVAVLNREANAIEAACFFTDTVNLCSMETKALGIYTTGTVYEPSFYNEWAGKLRNGEMPLPLWVYVGLVRDENGLSGYTYGLTLFGRLELEIIGTSRSHEELYNFLYGVCEGILSEGMYFHDGETLSFTSDQRLTITKSKAVYVEGDSFKIEY